MKLFIILLLICLCFQIVTSAETIILKSGKTVEGKIVEKTDKYIKIDFYGVPLTYFLDEIVSDEEKAHPEEVVEETAESAVSKKYNDYLNSDFGIMISYPADWYLWDSSEDLQKQQPGMKLFGVFLTKDKYDGNDEDLPFPNIQLMGFKMPIMIPGISTETMADSVINDIRGSSSVKLLGDVEKVKINDREWAKINYIEDGTIRGMICSYVDKNRGINYNHQITSKVEDFDLYEQDFLDVLEGIKF